jgi:hypothetical protein
MALSGSQLGGFIDSTLVHMGSKGNNRTVFCNAVGAGVVMSIVGQSFTTIDAGLTPGSGIGTGTGITGLNIHNMIEVAISEMPSTGHNARKLFYAIMKGVIEELANATLTTTDTPVYLGKGDIVVGSILVIETVMALNIFSQLQTIGANGSNLMPLAKAIAAGIAREIISDGGGSVTIVGTPTGIPVIGVGTGSGTIS